MSQHCRYYWEDDQTLSFRGSRTKDSVGEPAGRSLTNETYKKRYAKDLKYKIWMNPLPNIKTLYISNEYDKTTEDTRWLT